MKKADGQSFSTRVVHHTRPVAQWQGATLPPIFQTAAFAHDTAENLSNAFAGKNTDPIYSRLTNPTNQALEKVLTGLEGGAGAIVMASGMAAVANTCMALLRSGDEFVAGTSLFMSTYQLFAGIFKKYGITVRAVNPLDLKAVNDAVTDRTRFVYIETIGNPKMDVPDIRALADAAHGHGLPLVVDNTLGTPFLCRPLELGADAVIHSTTKYLCGHGAAMGGAVIDGGAFDWTQKRFADFAPFVERKGSLALLDKIWREHHINFGATQAPLHSYLTLIGIDTLALRMERHTANAMVAARFLKDRPEVAWVNYPGLDDHPCHAVAARQFEGRGFGGLLTFGLKEPKACARFINRLKLVLHLANLGDCRTLVIHPFSTQYVSFDDAVRKKLAIGPEMLRLSVGIENPDDICADIAQALEQCR
ncbi:MAG: aminotransferase class I/II-fold pyridoxal phosphate-dependent enzyme [Thermodesulfobacteriota bacterium]|nr:aminotransferase class I/II-fold pyridoxal phosphate-dependent enzyme [Thermodesulfobacteriota bacterium]